MNVSGKMLGAMSDFRRYRYSIRCCVGLAFIAIWLVCGVLALAQTTASIPEEIEWTWEVRPPQPNSSLPNVLLLGDSISRNYYPQVKKDLEGVANVYLMACSTSVGDPRLALEIAEFKRLEAVPFRVVHFNNGMHGWGYSEAQFKQAFPELIRNVQQLADPGGALIWASITPVRGDESKDAKDGAKGSTVAAPHATNPRIDQRNSIASSFVQAAGIAVDDQHALMIHHAGLYEDSVHFNKAGAELMGDQAAATIRAALKN